MTRSFRIAAFLLVTSLGAYGCAKGPGSPPTESSAAKVQKLEDDYRGALAAREQLRIKLVAAEEQGKRLKQQAEQLEAEKDALRAEVKARSGERDALQAQYESFRKSLRDMLGAADTAVGKLNLPAPAAEPTVASLSTAPRN